MVSEQVASATNGRATTMILTVPPDEATFVLTQAQKSVQTITVTVSYTDGGGTDETLTSAPTNAVTNINDASDWFADHYGHAHTRSETLTAVTASY